MTENLQQYPPLRQIYFYLTQGCNLACRHCWLAPHLQQADQTGPSLDLDLFRSVLDQAEPLGLTTVKLTGGEPLLHPRIREILEIVRDRGMRLFVETNGVLCTPELAGLIRECERPFVSVSLDGADAGTHEWIRGVRGSFDRAISGIRDLAGAGLSPQIIMTVMRRNRDQMEPMVRLAESLGAGSVKFNIVQPTARGESLHKSGEALSVNELIQTGRWVDADLSRSSQLRLVFDEPMAFRPLSKLFANDGGCGVCGIFGILGVLADGSYALCGIGETVPELVFGHAASDRLERVWHGSPVLRDIREGLPGRLTGICGECLMKDRCLGSCIAQNYYSDKNLWAPFWYCEEASRLGLFPASRHAKGVARRQG